MKAKKIISTIGSYLIIATGAGIAAAGINIFLFPYRIAPGGITGLATIVYYLLDDLIPLGLLIIALNLPLFIAGIIKLGWRFMLRTLYATVSMSIIIDLTAPFMIGLASRHLVSGDNEMMLFSLFGGALLGIGMGIIFRFDATTGGTDLMAELAKRGGLNLTMGQAIFIFDAVIVIMAGVFFKSLILALYAIIAVIVASKAVDVILEGFSFSKGMFIISNHSEIIAQRILNELERGLTGFQGTGKYTNSNKEILFCVARAKFIPGIKKIVKESDPDAFVVVTNVHEVLGAGFRGFDNKIS
ncbi:MAG: YitT family protein [Clostridia bacterium]|nr:YitT family protein [Clostridia bacterium]